MLLPNLWTITANLGPFLLFGSVSSSSALGPVGTMTMAGLVILALWSFSLAARLSSAARRPAPIRVRAAVRPRRLPVGSRWYR